MKNHKGAIATLLTLGLVLVGTLITLGTSFFVNNKKTNLASNSMAATSGSCSPKTSSNYDKNTCTGASKSGCLGNPLHCDWIDSAASATTSDTTSTTLNPGAGCKSYDTASEECDNPTTTGCKKVNGVQYYKCVETVAPVAGTNLIKCGMTISDATASCSQGIDEAGCTSGTARCKPKPAVDVSAATEEKKYSCCKVTNNSSYCGGNKRIQNQGNAFVTDCAHNGLDDCNTVGGPSTSGAAICPNAPVATTNTTYTAAGGTVASTGQSCCFKKNGKVYVYATYQSMVNNQMLDSSGNPDCGRQSVAVIKSYGADSSGAFVCPGGATNMMSETEYTNLVATVTLRLCKDGKAGTCLFGDADAATGPAKCSSGLQESGIKGCKGVLAQYCTDLKNIDTCVAAQRAGKNCAWDSSTNNCIIPGTNAPAGGDIKSAGETCGYEDDCITSYTCVVNAGDIIKPHTGGKCIKYTPPVVETGSCTPGTQVTCPAGSKKAGQPFDYYKSKSCTGSNINDQDCYGTAVNSCASNTWSEIWNNQCNDTNLATGIDDLGGAKGIVKSTVPACKSIDPNIKVPDLPSFSVGITNGGEVESQDLSGSANSFLQNQAPAIISAYANVAEMETNLSSKMNDYFNSEMNEAIQKLLSNKKDILPGSHIYIKVGDRVVTFSTPLVGQANTALEGGNLLVKGLVFNSPVIGGSKIAFNTATKITNYISSNLTKFCK